MHPWCQHNILIINGYFGLKNRRPQVISSVLNYFSLMALARMNISISISIHPQIAIYAGEVVRYKGTKSLEKKWEPWTGEGKVDPGWTSQVVCLLQSLDECVYIDYMGKVVEGEITLCYYNFQTYAILDCCHGEYFPCIIWTLGHKLISENMIKMQNILCLWQKVTVGQGQVSIRCKQSVHFPSYSVIDLLPDLNQTHYFCLKHIEKAEKFR